MRPRMESFDDMGLQLDLLRGIYSYGLEKPSEIQQHIGPMLEGRNLIARAESGTGKTVAFAIGVLHLVDCQRHASQALVLASGREQALQTQHVILALGECLGVNCHACIGGTSVGQDIYALRCAPQVVVGTTGRIMGMIEKWHLDTRYMKVLVLDDADALVRSNKRAINGLRSWLPSRLQLCLFSATLPHDVVQWARQRCGRSASEVSTGAFMPAALRHFYVNIPKEEWKFDTLCHVYQAATRRQSIIFVNTRRKADWLADAMNKCGLTVSTFHAELDQKERDLVLREFRAGLARVLITADLLERGIDVQQVNLVINYDLPSRADSYVHRAARAGRFHRPGVVVSFTIPGGGDEEALWELVRPFKVSAQELPANLAELL